ncbi:M20 family metallopeptidase [Paenibacillus sp. S150]|uniref:M20 family metallopeptidase n=1 Tax=Paenibacillus sp. S150 TaxID=2749826 RepID=UPI001C55DDAF|nr:M20 family metallopeptidase [Paenibacillus sp. S150]MBW4084256.1 M20 family metallopeptidase [Paenibacillus sp. S150]
MGQERVILAVLDAVSPDEIESLLCRLIEIEGHQDVPDQERGVAGYIAGWFRELGIECRLEEAEPNRLNVIARIPGTGSGAALLLNGHMDTVPGYGMEHAFKASRRNGRIYGRGSADMKGALAAMMLALAGFHRSGVRLDGDLLFAATVGEETYSPGAYHLAGSGISADYAIIGEPTGLRVGIAHKGVAWYEAEFPGLPVHGSVPELGINAIYRSSRWISHIQDRYLPLLKQRKHPLLGSPTLNIGMIEGGTRPVIVPGRAVVKFERRLLPGESAESALRELIATLEEVKADYPDFEGEVRIMDNFHGVPHAPMQTPPDSRLVAELLKAYRSESAGEAHAEAETPIGLQFWTDGALLQQFCADTVVCGPGSIEQAHSDEEFIETKQLLQACRMYIRSACALCGGAS